ncbi:TAM domain methyltransferase [Colletotrichum higginsianum]|uniref:TAM domain methyltransferase n=1 Tax=Colletotrichum higginsianum (strain IMI 349063) TaxID=759273 RepID=H1VJH2_COLHI|nr:TAM domain methyltransferase [Colletotrichum higginsianum]
MADLFAASAANVAAGAPPAAGPPHPPPPDLLGPIEIEDEGIPPGDPRAYKFPNDDVGLCYFRLWSFLSQLITPQFELDRLDLAHAMMVKAIGNRLYRAPVRMEQAHRILDIGTGTGICAHRLSAPSLLTAILMRLITGIDLSAIQPQWVPYNVRFEVDDIESPWIEGRKYDFIMCRYMVASIKDWPGLVDNIYE